MAFFRRSPNANFNLLSAYSWYVPGISGMFYLLLMLLFGTLIAQGVGAVFLLAFGVDSGMDYFTLITYPIMFIPAMIACRKRSIQNMMFEDGYAIDNNHFGGMGFFAAGLLCAIATICLGFCMDPVSSLLPPMPEWLESALTQMTNGKLWVDLICVGVFAPFFEEWLCRGMILRWLLNYAKDGQTFVSEKGRMGDRGIKPIWAILISSAFFAVIHLNPWQAIPAFALGCLFGYVYWRTGSLKLTMLMHCVNNVLAVALSRIPALENADSYMDVFQPLTFWGIFAGAIVLLLACIKLISTVRPQRPEGNCDRVASSNLF